MKCTSLLSFSLEVPKSGAYKLRGLRLKVNIITPLSPSRLQSHLHLITSSLGHLPLPSQAVLPISHFHLSKPIHPPHAHSADIMGHYYENVWYCVRALRAGS